VEFTAPDSWIAGYCGSKPHENLDWLLAHSSFALQSKQHAQEENESVGLRTNATNSWRAPKHDSNSPNPAASCTSHLCRTPPHKQSIDLYACINVDNASLLLQFSWNHISIPSIFACTRQHDRSSTCMQLKTDTIWARARKVYASASHPRTLITSRCPS
jgi:hypothetical protein